MSTINCLRLNGQFKVVERTNLIWRPAVFALIVQAGNLLVLTLKATGKYHIPGGGVELGDSVQATLLREVNEETGIAIKIGPLVHFNELFFYYDPSGKAYHGLHFYYRCQPKSTALVADEQVQDGSAGQPRWVPIDQLKPDDFQSEGEAILACCQATS